MSKVITMTQKMMDECKQDFANSLANIKLFDGKVQFNKVLTPVNQKATVVYTAIAWAKVVALLANFDKEVAWHGVVERVEGEDAIYLISDIVVYPQTVTGATVSMDEATYAKWLMENYEDERFNHLRMQGHSHVNMGTTPSSVDLTHQDEILRQLGADDFYIFMIYNKQHKVTSKIYDMKRNTLFDDTDITVQVEGFSDFLQEAKSLVVDKPTVATYSPHQHTNKTYKGGSGKQKTSIITPSQIEGYADWYSGYGRWPGGET